MVFQDCTRYNLSLKSSFKSPSFPLTGGNQAISKKHEASPDVPNLNLGKPCNPWALEMVNILGVAPSQYSSHHRMKNMFIQFIHV